MKQFYRFSILVLAITFFIATAFSQPGGRMQAASSSYGTGLAEDVVIQIDPETGSLIVITDEETNVQIKTIIDSLDRPIPQVLIKVLFLEVTHGDDLDLGVEGSFQFDSDRDKDIVETIFGVASQTQGGFYRVIEEDLEVTLRAMAQVSKLEVLSRPSILARHNKEAVITVGQEVPFIQNSRVTSDGQIINTVEYEDIGIILQVTPYITPEGMVEMDLMPEISTLSAETVPISDTVNAPVFSKRSAETRVVVPDGKTVVIGGLMEDNKTESVSKVPLLGDIPLLGAAFRRTIKNNTKTELLIFLTPRVVSAAEQLTELTRSETQKAELSKKVYGDHYVEQYSENLEE